MDLRLSSAALSSEPTTPPDRRTHAKPPIHGGVTSMTSPILSSFSPACSPGRSHVHSEYEARLYSPASATSGNATPSSTLGPAAAASVGIGFRDSFVVRTPPRRCVVIVGWLHPAFCYAQWAVGGLRAGFTVCTATVSSPAGQAHTLTLACLCPTARTGRDVSIPCTQ